MLPALPLSRRKSPAQSRDHALSIVVRPRKKCGDGHAKYKSENGCTHAKSSSARLQIGWYFTKFKAATTARIWILGEPMR